MSTALKLRNELLCAAEATKLYDSLTAEYPAPWRLTFHPDRPHYGGERYVSAIFAANGVEPLTLETHSGDGDMFYLGSNGAIALTSFVNQFHELNQPKP